MVLPFLVGVPAVTSIKTSISTSTEHQQNRKEERKPRKQKAQRRKTNMSQGNAERRAVQKQKSVNVEWRNSVHSKQRVDIDIIRQKKEIEKSVCVNR